MCHFYYLPLALFSLRATALLEQLSTAGINKHVCFKNMFKNTRPIPGKFSDFVYITVALTVEHDNNNAEAMS